MAIALHILPVCKEALLPERTVCLERRVPRLAAVRD
jgi:hypothetical protein